MNNHLSEFGGTPTLFLQKDNAEPSQIDIAWFAGIFDGEGSVGFMKDKRRNNYSIGLHITNTDMSLLEKCQRIIFSVTGEYAKLHKKPIYASQLKTNHDVYTLDLRKQENIVAIFELIVPHLTCKQERVRLAIEILKSRLSEIDSFGQNSKWGEHSLRLCEQARNYMAGVTTKRETPIAG